MSIVFLLLLAVGLLAFANGANDNFKGVASLHGLPVSTTHVTVGSLLGMGTVTGQARWRTVRPVLASWAVTLPMAAALAALAGLLFRYLPVLDGGV